uniref:Uncharacterized protein n=1 Tax=Steinernema glaseri TaxID=37863 RepID=A0A1I7Y9T9_9BILA
MKCRTSLLLLAFAVLLSIAQGTFNVRGFFVFPDGFLHEKQMRTEMRRQADGTAIPIDSNLKSRLRQSVFGASPWLNLDNLLGAMKRGL